MGAAYAEEDIPSYINAIQELYNLFPENAPLPMPHAFVNDDEQLGALLRNPNVWTNTWHYGGTCSLGTCAGANMKVEGTTNVFVGDASALPESLNGHFSAPATYMGHFAARFATANNLSS